MSEPDRVAAEQAEYERLCAEAKKQPANMAEMSALYAQARANLEKGGK